MKPKFCLIYSAISYADSGRRWAAGKYMSSKVETFGAAIFGADSGIDEVQMSFIQDTYKYKLLGTPDLTKCRQEVRPGVWKSTHDTGDTTYRYVWWRV